MHLTACVSRDNQGAWRRGRRASPRSLIIARRTRGQMHDRLDTILICVAIWVQSQPEQGRAPANKCRASTRQGPAQMPDTGAEGTTSDFQANGCCSDKAALEKADLIVLCRRYTARWDEWRVIGIFICRRIISRSTHWHTECRCSRKIWHKIG